jgi:hypothetical protein
LEQKLAMKQSSLYEPLAIFIIKGGEMTKSLIFKHSYDILHFAT